MRPPTTRRFAHASLACVTLAMMLLGVSSVTQGAVPIREGGTTGVYDVTDTPAEPGARCRYEGTAGTWYLQRVHVRAPTIFGTSMQLRSVGYRLLLQRRTAQGWTTAQRGKLISGVADRDTAAALTGSTVVRDVAKAPNWPRYRAALKLMWWDAQARLRGRVVLAIEHHRRTSDHSVGRACHGREPIASATRPAERSGEQADGRPVAVSSPRSVPSPSVIEARSSRG